MRHRIDCLPLETRRLLAAAVVDQQLVIDGTAGDDVITAAFNAGTGQIDVMLNGASDGSFAPTDFYDMRINCLAGNDSVTISSGRRGIVDGGDGNDTLVGGRGSDILGGGAGNDLLDGGSSGDILYADRGVDDNSPIEIGDDQLFGRAFSDVLFSDGGDDLLDGGGGVLDSVDFGRRSENLSISLDGVANDGASGEASQVVNTEAVSGGSGNDLIVGNGNDNTLTGGEGSDTLVGGAGNDTLDGGTNQFGDPDTSADSLDGGSGGDQLSGGGGNDTLRGQSGDDRLVGDFGNDSMIGGSGDDEIFAGTFDPDGVQLDADTAMGESGNDSLQLSVGTHVVDGGSGNDNFFIQDDAGGTLSGSGGDDNFLLYLNDYNGTFDAFGGSGEDTVAFFADFGADISLDNVANDGRATNPSRAGNVHSDFEVLISNSAPNGDDRLSAAGAPHGVTLNGFFGNDTLIGSGFADLIEGGDGSDSIDGGTGDDVLRGGGGRDTLTGGPGSDSFNGGFGDDLMNAADGEADTVNGAQGLGDSADIDELLDTVIRVESTT